MEEYINLLQEFAYNLAVIALPIIAAFLIALLRAWVKKALAEAKQAKPYLYGYLKDAVEMAVGAAEQMELAGLVNDKKEYALDTVQAFLDEHGWDEVDIGVLEAAIEAEVLKQFPK